MGTRPARRPALAVLLALALAGCAGARGYLDGLLPGGGEPSAFYVDADTLTLYRTPGRDELTRLSRGERVLRSRVEKGWAFVRVESNGLEGWVDNARLVWRTPRTAAPEPAATAPVASKAAPSEPAAPPQAAPEETAAPPDASAAAPPPPPQTEEKPKTTDGAPVSPSVFDPY